MIAQPTEAVTRSAHGRGPHWHPVRGPWPGLRRFGGSRRTPRPPATADTAVRQGLRKGRPDGPPTTTLQRGSVDCHRVDRLGLPTRRANLSYDQHRLQASRTKGARYGQPNGTSGMVPTGKGCMHRSKPARDRAQARHCHRFHHHNNNAKGEEATGREKGKERGKQERRREATRRARGRRRTVAPGGATKPNCLSTKKQNNTATIV